MKVSERLVFVFIYAIIGTIIFRRWSMSYLFEILPSLLSGATMTLQVFALVLLFSPLLVAFAYRHWENSSIT